MLLLLLGVSRVVVWSTTPILVLSFFIMDTIFPTSGMTTVVYDGFHDCGVEHEHIDGVMTPIYHWFSFTRGVVTYNYDAVNDFCYATAPAGAVLLPGFELVSTDSGEDRFELLEGRSVGFVKS